MVATDLSDNGSDPNSDNGADANSDGIVGNDPTPIIIADIGIAKSVFGVPRQLSNGNFRVTYRVVVENTGTVNLENLSLIEDLATQFGTGLIGAGAVTITSPPANPSSTVGVNPTFDGVSETELIDISVGSTLAVGDSFVLGFYIEVDTTALPVGASNSIVGTAEGIDTNGNRIIDAAGNPITAMDSSDSGTDASSNNIGAPGDTFGSDDPTLLQIPSIGLAKSAGDAIANGDNFDVTFTLVFENNGTVDLNNLTLIDDVENQFGEAFVSVSGVAVQNFVGTGTTPTVNPLFVGDTTESVIFGGTANVGDTFEVVFTVTIDPDASGASTMLSNSALGGGEALDENGNPLTDAAGSVVTASDVSDSGTETNGENGAEATVDGLAANDPTEVVIADLGIAKTVVGEPLLTDIGNFVVTYEVVVENTGTVDLGSLSLLEDVASQFGGAFVDARNLTLASSPSDAQSSISVNSTGFNGNSSSELLDTSAANVLRVGDSFTLQFDVEINPADVTDPLENQVVGTAGAIDSSGMPLLDSAGNPIAASDLSDSGTDPGSINANDPSDNGTSNDPSALTPPPIAASSISGTVFQDDDNDGIQDPGELGIAGVEIILTGFDVLGNAVDLTVLTDAEGTFVFDGLSAGNYEVAQIQPGDFDDGIDSGDASFIATNDRFSNIQLGFGQTSESTTFAERLTGASGNPPQLPSLPSVARSPISNLINNALAGPGPIYSGVPINSNANPLSLDSGLPVTGGYAVTDSLASEDCGCPEPINPCCEPTEFHSQAVVIEEMIVDQPVEEMDVEVDNECCPEETLLDNVEADCETTIDPCHQGVGNPGFLKRFANWLRR